MDPMLAPNRVRRFFRHRISPVLPVTSRGRASGWPSILLAWIWLASPLSLPAQHFPAAVPDVKFLREGGVTSITMQEDGKLIITGWFTSINGVPRPGLARLNANGSVDATWTPAVGGYVAAVNGAHVFAAVETGMTNGTGRQRLVKIGVGNSGEVDATWLPQILGLDSVFAMTVAGDALFLCAQIVSNGLTTQRLFKVSATGTGQVDPSWGNDSRGSALCLLVDGSYLYVGNDGDSSWNGVHRRSLSDGGGIDAAWGQKKTDGAVYSLAVDGADLFVGGRFYRIDEQVPLNTFRNGLAKVSTQGRGAIDSSWDPNVQGYVQVLTVAGTNLYMGGLIASVGGQPKQGLARLDLSGPGLVDPSWSPAVSSVAQTRVQVRALTAHGANVFVGGEFSAVNSQLTLSLAKLNSTDGARHEAFQAQAQSRAQVFDVAMQPDGQVVVGGDFLLADHLPRQSLARIKTDGTVDEGWNPTPDGVVQNLIVAGESLYVAGSFKHIGGQTRDGLAKVSLATTDRADALWDPNPQPPGGSVRLLAAPGFHVYVGGDFTRIGGLGRTNFARLFTGGTGAADPGWNVRLTYAYQIGPADYREVPAHVSAVAVSGNDVFVAGTFNRIEGQIASSFAKFTAGVWDFAWRPLELGSATALALSGTNLFVGGSGVKKLSTTGTGAADPAWNPLAGVCSVTVADLAISGSNLFVVGRFSGQNCPTEEKAAKFSTLGTGAQDASWGATFNWDLGDYSSVKTLAVSGSEVFLGGYFSSISGAMRDSFAFLPMLEAPLVQGTGPEFFISRNAANARGVSHFQITSVAGGDLYHSDGTTPIHTGEFITVEKGAAGVKFFGPANATFTVVSALTDTAAGSGSAATEARLEAPRTRVFLSSMQSLDNSACEMTLHGGIGRVYTIESSSNLIHWTSLLTLTNFTGATSVRDTNASGTRRSYRALQW